MTDPLATKRSIVALLEARNPLFDDVLALATGPGDGRLRQTIARALQKRPEAETFAATLRLWRARETDEFTLSAIDDALTPELAAPRRPRRTEDLPDIGATFRFLSGRLRHRVLNAMPRAGLKTYQLRTAIQRMGTAPPEDVLRRLDELGDALRAVEEAVDFHDETTLFERRIVELVSWLGSCRVLYSKSFPRVSISVDSERRTAYVLATEFLLGTIFRNLWDNSRQAVADPCRITTIVLADGDNVLVRILDSGRGFDAEDAERAFHIQYSSTQRAGRGHMEVNDAVMRLGGTATVQAVPDGSYRVVLSFPRADV